MNMIILGAPGAGKGTQAQKIAGYLDIPQISTGDLLRDAVSKGTKRGKQAEAYMNKGKLVPNRIIMGLIRARLGKDDCRKGFILDGFPRTKGQARNLESFATIDVVISIEVDLTILISRLTGRRTCGYCNAVFHIQNRPPKRKGICDMCGGKLFQRSDDNEETVRKRIETYRKNTQPLIGFYSGRSLLERVKGEGDVTEIYGNILEILEKVRERQKSAISMEGRETPGMQY